MKKIIAILGLALALAFSGAVLSKGDQGHHQSGHDESKHMMKHMFAKLDLSEEQKTAIKALQEQTHERIKSLHEEGAREDFKAEMKAILQAESFDDGAYRALLESKNAIAIEMEVFKGQAKNGVWNLLNAEQQEKFSAMMAKYKHKAGKKRMKKGKGKDKGKHQDKDDKQG